MMRQAHAKGGLVLQYHAFISDGGKSTSPRLWRAHTIVVPPQYSRGKRRSQDKGSMGGV